MLNMQYYTKILHLTFNDMKLVIISLAVFISSSIIGGDEASFVTMLVMHVCIYCIYI